MLSFIKEIYNEYQQQKLEQSILERYNDVVHCPKCNKIVNSGFYVIDDISFKVLFKCRDCSIKVERPLSILKSSILLSC